MITKEQIREYITGLGFCEVGFTHALPFDRLKEVLEDRQRAGYLSGFEKGNLQERCCPRMNFDWAKSIIAVAHPYVIYDNTGDNASKGFISSSAVGQDYHQMIRSKLEQAGEHISEKVEDFRYAIMVDTSPFADREVAHRSGIGWYGKNCSVITPSAGSAVFLGEMLTNLELDPDPLLEGDCGECSRCMDNCPTGALVKPYTLDARRCISYITQKRGVIPLEIRNKMGISIYGCDRCLLSCPHNKAAPCSRGLTDVDLERLIRMDKKEFEKEYKNTAWGWRGLNVLKRNAVIALGNLQNPKGLRLLEIALGHPSKVIRGHVAWAVGRIGGKEAVDILERCLANERDGYVRQEIKTALQGLLRQTEKVHREGSK